MSLRAHIFRHFVCRLGALPIDVTEQLVATESIGTLQVLRSTEVEILARRDSVSEILYRAIAVAQDVKQRRLLISARRALFNGDRPPDNVLLEVEGVLPEEQASSVSRYAALIDQRRAQTEEARRLFWEGVERSRTALSNIVRNEAFQRGLLMSSPSLFNAQTKYVDDRPQGKLIGRLDRIERGLLKYVLRASMKATPFGTFCAVIPGDLQPAIESGANNSGLEIQGEARAITARTRLNKRLLSQLLPELFRTPEVRNKLRVAINSTLIRKEREYCYLAVVNGLEMCQRLERTPIVELVLQLVSESQMPTFGWLVKSIELHSESRSGAVHAENFAIRLVEIGLIVLRLGIREQDPDWDRPLSDLLDGGCAPITLAVRALLKQLRAAADKSLTASLTEWTQLVNAARGAVRETLAEITDEGCEPFREDATTQASATLTRDAALQTLQNDLCSLVDVTYRVAWPRVEQATMRHFFDVAYSTGGDVPLLAFYEDYCRHHYKEHLAALHGARVGADKTVAYYAGNPLSSPMVESIQAARREILRVIVSRWRAEPDAEEIRIELAELNAVVVGVPKPGRAPGSIGIFGTLVSPSERSPEVRFVTKGLAYGLGYGRFLSRWLYMLPDDFRKMLISANDAEIDVCLAELCGDGNHNANLHPRLVSHELTYPAFEGTSEANTISLAEVVVRTDPTDPHALCLVNKTTGVRIVPLDLGFQILSAKPPLYQLLASFAPPCAFWIRLPNVLPDYPYEGRNVAPNPVVKKDAPEMTVKNNWRDKAARSPSSGGAHQARSGHRPRIVIGTLVASRRCWSFAAGAVPVATLGESQFNYYKRVYDWWAAHTIPRKVFVHLEESTQHGVADTLEQPDDEPSVSDKKPMASQRSRHAVADDLKPQFIDFGSPLMVNVLRAMTDRISDHWLVIEECYPALEMLPRLGERRHSSEQILQLICHVEDSASVF